MLSVYMGCDCVGAVGPVNLHKPSEKLCLRDLPRLQCMATEVCSFAKGCRYGEGKRYLDQLACQPLKFPLAEQLGLAADAALGTPKGNVHHTRLPCHQACQPAAA